MILILNLPQEFNILITKKYIRRYKPYFVIRDPYEEQLTSINKSLINGDEVCFKKIYTLSEAVIRTEKYAELLKIWFEEVIESIKNKTFRETKDVTKYLNYFFDEYGIMFVFTGYDDYSDGSGISKMQTGSQSYLIQVICNQDFKYNIKINSYFLIQTFYELLVHELTHRGQFLLNKLNLLNDKKNKKTELGTKNYLSQKHELMAYANQAIEELRFEGFSNKEIIIMIKSFNFKNSHSTTIKNYFEYFNKNNKEDLQILKQFFKYMYEYLYGDIKRSFN